MRWLQAVTTAGILAAAPLGMAAFQTGATPYQERDFLSRVRRLTVEGRRAGEGYWSPDGKHLVFQSEREPGNPFYQIYEGAALLAGATPATVLVGNERRVGIEDGPHGEGVARDGS